MKKKRANNSKYLTFLVLFIAVFTILVILIGRIAFIQVVKGPEYSEEAARQQTKNQVLSPKRGTIYDATGKVLARSEQVDTVSINPEFIAKEDKEKVAKAFSDIFGIDMQEALDAVNSDSSVETIAKKVEQDKINVLERWMKENKIYRGINIDEDVKRYYPFDNLASNLIGFCNADNQGLDGIELAWDEVLTGTSGKLVTSTDSISRNIPDKNETYYAAQNGSDVTLTIDANVQLIVEKYLKQACAEHNPKNGGTAIVMKPSTGDVLAMATYPDYNLNDPRNPTDKYADGFAEKDEEEKYNTLYKMWRNRCVQDGYEPGSVYKIITASIALQEDYYTTDHDGDFYCPGYQQVEEDVRVWCWKTSGAHASESLREALMNSCNPAMMQISATIGARKEYQYYKAFGLMDRTGIQTSGEANSSYWDIEDVGAVEQATMAFGQRFTVTPIQMITAISAVANNGVLVKPRIVKSVTNTDTGTVTTIQPEEVRQVLSKDVSAKMMDMLTSVVSDGTGTYGAVPGYTTAGKTGTSEPDPNHPENGYSVSFVSIAPSSSPEVVCLVTLYGLGDSASGGGTAGPVVSQILSEVLPYLGIPSEDMNTNTETANTGKAIPDVKNKTIGEARSILEAAGFNVQVGDAKDDAIAIDQVPKPGISLTEGGIVKLYSNETTKIRQTVAVPNLKNMSYSEAMSALLAAELNLSVSGNIDGIVVTQDPIAGTEVETGTIVYATMHSESTDTH